MDPRTPQIRDLHAATSPEESGNLLWAYRFGAKGAKAHDLSAGELEDEIVISGLDLLYKNGKLQMKFLIRNTLGRVGGCVTPHANHVRTRRVSPDH